MADTITHSRDFQLHFNYSWCVVAKCACGSAVKDPRGFAEFAVMPVCRPPTDNKNNNSRMINTINIISTSNSNSAAHNMHISRDTHPRTYLSYLYLQSTTHLLRAFISSSLPTAVRGGTIVILAKDIFTPTQMQTLKSMVH